MTEIYQDVFYGLDHLDNDDLKALFRQALAFSDVAYVDKLDCEESWLRKRTSNNPEAYIDKIGSNTRGYYEHNVFIHRRGDIRDKNSDGPRQWILEIGSSTMGNPPDYFLFIFVDESYLEALTTQFNLKPIN